MPRTVDATALALWEEALGALRTGERPVWIPADAWERARNIEAGGTTGWIGGHLGFIEDLAFVEAVRRTRAGAGGTAELSHGRVTGVTDVAR